MYVVKCFKGRIAVARRSRGACVAIHCAVVSVYWSVDLAFCSASCHLSPCSGRAHPPGSCEPIERLLHSVGKPAMKGLRLRGGNMSCLEDESEAAGEDRLVCPSGDHQRQLQELQDEVNLAASLQVKTQRLVHDMAEDMIETHKIVQGKLTQLEAAGQERTRLELQRLADALSEQMKLVQTSGLLDSEYIDLFDSKLRQNAADSASGHTAPSPPEM